MSKSLKYILILIVFAGVLACKKKEYPEPGVPNENFFYSRLIVDGVPLEINSGKDSYYMYSSFSMDSSNIYNLVGDLRRSDCDNCANRLRIQINDTKFSSPNDPIAIDEALQLKSYSFLTGTNDLEYSVNFTSAFNKTVSSVSWDFGDGTKSTDPSPVHIFQAGKYKVTLTIIGTDMCQSVIVNTVNLIAPGDLNAYVSASSTSNTVSFIPHVTGGEAPYSYLWDFGDGTQSGVARPDHTYPFKGNYGVKLKVTDATGKIINCNYDAVAGNDPSSCSANFSFLTTYTGKRFGLSKTSIQFTNSAGVMFTSDFAGQPLSSQFQILEIEEFVKNESGNPVKKVKLKFNCTLYNGTKTVSLEGTEVFVGFAYK